MRMKAALALALVFVATGVAGVRAATRTRRATASVTVSALAKLSLSATSVAFADASPDAVPQIPATGGAISITARMRTTPGGPVSLSVLASDDLRSGSLTIPVSAITWTAGGAGFVGGTMNRVTAQSVGAWVGSGSWSGTQSYRMANSWTYTTGSYSASFVYTLTAP